MITWLHLSDFHITKEDENGSNAIINSLFKDIEDFKTKNKIKFDFIIITGDITYHGNGEEYIIAKDYFDELLRKTGVNKENLYIIPGNHDINRKITKNFDDDIKISNIKEYNNLFDSNQKLNRIIKKFSSYRKFYNSYFKAIKNRRFNEEKFFHTSIYEKNDGKLFHVKIGLYGLNSCINSDERDNNEKKKFIVLGKKQIDKALSDLYKRLELNDIYLKICYFHHPIEELNENQKELAKYLAERFDFVLVGHEHASETKKTLFDSGYDFTYAIAGTSYETDNIKRRSEAYNITQINPKTGEGVIYFRMKPYNTIDWSFDNTKGRGTGILQFKIERLKRKYIDHFDINTYKNNEIKFIPIDMYDLKSPAEMIGAFNDQLSEVFSDCSKRQNRIEKQIKEFESAEMIEKYPGSWAENEVRLMGYYILNQNQKLKRELNNQIITNLYDAGSGNNCQYRVITDLVKNKAKHIHLNKKFSYFGQDFYQDWEELFVGAKIPNSYFSSEILPKIPNKLGEITLNNNISLLSCTHVFHYMRNYPLLIYTTLFSFIKLLKVNGFCYITIPEKSALPGMLDLLIKAAKDAKFEIIDYKRCRLKHIWEPYFIASFSYIILKKVENFENEKYLDELLKASIAIAENSNDIDKELSNLNKELICLLEEKEPCLRFLYEALDIISSNKYKYVKVSEKDCQKYIVKSYENVHKCFLKKLILEIDNDYDKWKKKFAYNLSILLFWLIYYFSYDINQSQNLSSIKENIFQTIKKIFNEDTKEIRISKNKENLIEGYNKDKNAKILQFILNLYEYDKIDLRREFISTLEQKDLHSLIPK
ncbi:MAG: metallophosphoesterase family protein [Promethearchaeota archaeon]